MKQLLDIIRTYENLSAPMALATVVRTSGSSCRRAGARMLIVSENHTVGCLSGGCLDHEVVLRGLEAVQTQQPALITCDALLAHDQVLDRGGAGRGLVEVFVEPLPAAERGCPDDPGLLGFMANLLRAGGTGVVATVVNTRGDIGLQAGNRVMVDDLDQVVSNLPNDMATEILAAYAWDVMANGRSELICHQTEGGSADIFVEICLPQTHLIVLGAGPDAVPLVRMAHELGYKISVVDHRPAVATRKRFLQADEVLMARPGGDLPWYFFDEKKVAVIMTHKYEFDRDWLGKLLPFGLPYLGLMGPRPRAEKMLAELQNQGAGIREIDLLTLHNPIGLDLGAENPEQFALAILAEIQTTLAGREAVKISRQAGPVGLPAAEPMANLPLLPPLAKGIPCLTSP